MAVDFCPPKAVSVASGGFCTSYGECFASAEELRAHCKSERHVYNVKRQLAGLKPISQEAWERKLRERETEESTKGRAHLKAGKQERKAAEGSEPAAVADLMDTLILHRSRWMYMSIYIYTYNYTSNSIYTIHPNYDMYIKSTRIPVSTISLTCEATSGPRRIRPRS